MAVRNHRFLAEFTSNLGQYYAQIFSVPSYIEAYQKAWSLISDKPAWMLFMLAPLSDKVVPLLDENHHNAMRSLADLGLWRYRA